MKNRYSSGIELKNKYGALQVEEQPESDIMQVEEQLEFDVTQLEERPEPDDLWKKEWPKAGDTLKMFPKKGKRGKNKAQEEKNKLEPEKVREKEPDVVEEPEKTREEDPDDVEEVNEVEEMNEVVEITVDSVAARSVWPKKKKGVQRKAINGRKPRLAAANGTNIDVQGEALFEFDMKGRKCGMKFLDADVKKPLVAVSAMEDEGNTVVFSKKWGSYVENDETGERIPLERRGGTYVMILTTKKDERRAEVAMRKNGEMEIGGMEDDEEETPVFRRQAQ